MSLCDADSSVSAGSSELMRQTFNTPSLPTLIWPSISFEVADCTIDSAHAFLQPIKWARRSFTEGSHGGLANTYQPR